jgi:hypothetical protein
VQSPYSEVPKLQGKNIFPVHDMCYNVLGKNYKILGLDFKKSFPCAENEKLKTEKPFRFTYELLHKTIVKNLNNKFSKRITGYF